MRGPHRYALVAVALLLAGGCSEHSDSSGTASGDASSDRLASDLGEPSPADGVPIQQDSIEPGPQNDLTGGGPEGDAGDADSDPSEDLDTSPEAAEVDAPGPGEDTDSLPDEPEATNVAELDPDGSDAPEPEEEPSDTTDEGQDDGLDDAAGDAPAGNIVADSVADALDPDDGGKEGGKGDPDAADGGPEGSTGDPPTTIGLLQLDRAWATEDEQGGPHLDVIAVWGDAVYVANSYDVVATFVLGEGGSLDLAQEEPFWFPPPRCTSVALHLPSSSLYCTSPDPGDPDPAGVVTRLDAAEPLAPYVLEPLAIVDEEAAWSSLHVHGDTLWMAGFDDGLVEVSIAGDGSLGVPVPTGVGSHTVKVRGDGDHLVLTDLDLGVVIFDPESGQVVTSIEPPGPPLGLAMAAGRVAVALGSEGAIVYDLAGGELVEVATVQPRGVATAVDVWGDLLAVTCLSGYYTYDLTALPTQGEGIAYPFGFHPAYRIGLDARFVEAAPGGDSPWPTLIASDWWEMVHLAVDPSGRVVIPDMDLGRYVQLGDDAIFVAHNPGAWPLEVRLTSKIGFTVAEGELEPGGLVELVVPESKLDVSWGEELYSSLSLYLWSEEWIELGGGEQWDQQWKREVLVRPDEADPLLGHPALGDPFPESIVTAPGQPEPLPVWTEGQRVRQVHYTEDCVALWPELRDLAWQLEAGTPVDDALPVAINGRLTTFGWFIDQWRLESLTNRTSHGAWGTILVDGEPTYAGDDLYGDLFFLEYFPGGAHHPTDYLVGEAGEVEAVERMYRGRWPLR